MQLQQDVEKVLLKPAVTFETDRRYNNQQAWPFYYPFISNPYLNTDHLNNGLGLQGIKVPAGQVRDIKIRLERDAVYHQLNVKYTAFKIALGAAYSETISTTIGSKSATVSNGAAFSVGDSIAWRSTSGIIDSAVIIRINGNNLILEEAAGSTSVNSPVHAREYRYYDTPVLPYLGFSKVLTGTISIAPNQTPLTGEGFTVIGVGTAFLTELKAGDTITCIDSENATRTFSILSITNNNTLKLVNRLAPDTEVYAGTAFSLSGQYENNTGTVSLANGATNLIGVGTTFLTTYAVGDIIRLIDTAGKYRFLQVLTVNNNLSITITETFSGTVTAAKHQKVGEGLTGTITASGTTKTITGIGTAFLAELAEGRQIWLKTGTGSLQNVTISKVISNTVAITTNSFSGFGVAFPLSASLQESAFDVNNTLLYRPLTNYIRVSYIMDSLQGRYLYGGVQTFISPDSSRSGMQVRPHLIQSLQGERDGMGMLRTSTVQSYEAIVTVRVFNYHSEDILINGTLFGYKINIK